MTHIYYWNRWSFIISVTEGRACLPQRVPPSPIASLSVPVARLRRVRLALRHNCGRLVVDGKTNIRQVPNRTDYCIRTLSPRSNTTSMMPNTIKTGDFETSNPIDIVQTFNQVFSTIADTYVPCDNHEQHHNFQTLDEHVRSKLAQNTKFVIPDVTHEYVLHKLSTQPNRATGADGISAKLIKISASHIAASLRWIINLSLRTGVMPATWKHARVSPIYKTGDKAECGNYRPISVLCGISTKSLKGMFMMPCTHI